MYLLVKIAVFLICQSEEKLIRKQISKVRRIIDSHVDVYFLSDCPIPKSTWMLSMAKTRISHIVYTVNSRQPLLTVFKKRSYVYVDLWSPRSVKNAPDRMNILYKNNKFLNLNIHHERHITTNHEHMTC